MKKEKMKKNRKRVNKIGEDEKKKRRI